MRSDAWEEPIQDEAIAQYAACAVHRDVWPATADLECELQTTSLYVGMRDLGVPDGVADQIFFSDGDQHAGLVYGKAPRALMELGAEHGDAEVLAALAAFARDHAFGFATEGAVVEHLGEALGAPADVSATWHRWMKEIHGDEDLDYVDPSDD